MKYVGLLLSMRPDWSVAGRFRVIGSKKKKRLNFLLSQNVLITHIFLTVGRNLCPLPLLSVEIFSGFNASIFTSFPHIITVSVSSYVQLSCYVWKVSCSWSHPPPLSWKRFAPSSYKNVHICVYVYMCIFVFPLCLLTMFYILRIMFISHEISEKKNNIFNLTINENNSLFSLYILNFLWVLETKKKKSSFLTHYKCTLALIYIKII